MTNVKDQHLQETVKAAVDYIAGNGDFSVLRQRFNRLCKDWNADEFNPEDLSLDISDIARHIEDEPWVKEIAATPAPYRTRQMIVRVVEEFIHKYWYIHKEEITTKNVADVLRVADPHSRRHIIAQRVVIDCIHRIQTNGQLRRLDRLMDALATNPRMER